jgi:hypothetical protein
MSQLDFAKAMCISNSYLADIENLLQLRKNQEKPAPVKEKTREKP